MTDKQADRIPLAAASTALFIAGNAGNADAL